MFSELLPHQVYSGGALVLQAVATNPARDANALVSGTWDPGDGSGPHGIVVTNSLALELSHVYTGADNQPFTTTISVTDAGGHVFTDTMKIVIKPNVRETKVNMAIDKGLWNLHKRMTRTTSDGKPSAYWLGQNSLPATASTVQAFEINNHRESGMASKDPYVSRVSDWRRQLRDRQQQRPLGRFGDVLGRAVGEAQLDDRGLIDGELQGLRHWPDAADEDVAIVTPPGLPLPGTTRKRYAQQAQVLVQQTPGRFADRSAAAGPFFEETHVSRGAAFADFDSDGDWDAVVRNLNGPAVLLRNDAPAGRWARLVLEGRGCNRDAVTCQTMTVVRSSGCPAMVPPSPRFAGRAGQSRP